MSKILNYKAKRADVATGAGEEGTCDRGTRAQSENSLQKLARQTQAPQRVWGGSRVLQTHTMTPAE